MEGKAKQAGSRSVAMDVTRIVAVMLVVAVHFFWNNGFYYQTMLGKRMLAASIFRAGLSCCVPLFLVLSGYLMCHKKLEKRFYGGLSKTLLTYALATAACLLYQWLRDGEAPTPLGAVLSLFNYKGAPYSWYMEMYIGLFLLVPFLNILYEALGTQRRKQALLLTMLALTTLPSVLNVFNLQDPAWWANPASVPELDQLWPQWWLNTYPLTYYFLGCYLREFPLKGKTPVLLGLLGVSVVAFGCYGYWRGRGACYAWGVHESWGSLQSLVVTLLVFTLLSRVKGERLPAKAKYALWKISDLCLGIYLVSYIPDNYFYTKLNAAIPNMLDRLAWFPVITAAVFLCSLALSAVLQVVGKGVSWLIVQGAGLVKKAVLARTPPQP